MMCNEIVALKLFIILLAALSSLAVVAQET
jgi:hypothetical protein